MPFFGNVRHEVIELDRLGGALTNVCYKVTIGSAAYVLRLAGDGTSDYIDRTAEEHNARIAAEAGVNAEVVYFDARDGTMVTRFVEGISMNAGDGFGLDSGAPVRAARALGRVHRLGRVFRSRFDVFDAIDDYLDLLRERRTSLPEDYHEVRRKARAVRRALEASPAPLVPCHNDPWPGNLLDAGGRIYLIDWEYSGMNDPVWDLADLSVEAGFGPEQDRAMMEAYRGGTASAALYSRLEVYKAMSDLHWSIWGFVQHAKGNPAEDFWSYGLVRLGRSKARMGSADFLRHVGLVREGGRSRATKRAYRADPERRKPVRTVPESG
ncbi:MAG TPA: choline kinase family protein [Rubrobacter sp.]|nr:choline kinase family protein [Rubrobacter sp.]